MAINLQQEQQKQKEKVLTTINRMSDMELSSPVVIDTILEKVKVPMPFLDLTAGSIEIRSEVRIFDPENPPSPYTGLLPNESTEVTIFRVPILDKLSMLKDEKHGFFTTFTESHLEYTIYDSSLTAEQKKGIAQVAIESFQNALLTKRDAMAEFENGALKSFIESEVTTKLQKRGSRGIS